MDGRSGWTHPEGRGGHVTQWIDDRFTVVKTGEIGTGLLAAILTQLDIPKDEF